MNVQYMLNMPLSAEGHIPLSLIGQSSSRDKPPFPTYFPFRRHFDFEVVGVYCFQNVNNSLNLFPVSFVVFNLMAKLERERIQGKGNS